MASLDLVCSDGTVVRDPGAPASMRSGLKFTDSPASPTTWFWGSITSASFGFQDVFTRFGAGSDTNLSDVTTSCTPGLVVLGAKSEHWSGGQRGYPGPSYAGAAK